MVNRLVSVNESNELPEEVQAALVGQVETHFEDLTIAAETAANSATSSASAAEADAAAAEAARVLAEDAATQAAAPVDSAVADLVTDTGSATSAALAGAYISPATIDAQVAGLFGGVSATRTAADARYRTITPPGTYASRPAASAVTPGSFYYANDVMEMYQSNGTAWTLIRAGGTELGYAQSITASPAVTGSTIVDVPGLTTTFTVGESPIEIQVACDISHSAANGIVVVYIILDGTTICRPNLPAGPIGSWHTIERTVRRAGLTPGTTHTAKIGLATTAGTTVIQGDAGNPMSISVKTR